MYFHIYKKCFIRFMCKLHNNITNLLLLALIRVLSGPQSLSYQSQTEPFEVPEFFKSVIIVTNFEAAISACPSRIILILNT